MSTIASFYLSEVEEIDDLTNAKRLKDFDGSGYIYANLMVFLQEERNIDLTEHAADIESTHFLFTHKQKETFLDQLNPNKYSLTELQKFNEDFSDEGDEETARLTLDAIQVLHSNVSQIQHNNQVLLLIIG